MKTYLIIFTLFFSTLVSAAPINKFVVFGDSLSDNGNLYEYMKHQLPLSPPYYEGRFTNGPVWVELLTKFYFPNDSKQRLLDYAFGGAGVLDGDEDDEDLFTLRREMDSYFLAHQDKADENSLYIMWIGSNNYLAVPDDVEKTIREVTLGIKSSLVRLVEHGAKNILVVNLPDLGKVPAARDYEVPSILTYYSTRHNSILANTMVELRSRYADVKWFYFEVDQLMEEMFKDPQSFGFTNITDTCYEEMAVSASANPVLKMVATVKPKEQQDACTGYMFFDPVHPSFIAHEFMVERTKRLFDASGLKFE